MDCEYSLSSYNIIFIILKIFKPDIKESRNVNILDNK